MKRSNLWVPVLGFLWIFVTGQAYVSKASSPGYWPSEAGSRKWGEDEHKACPALNPGLLDIQKKHQSLLPFPPAATRQICCLNAYYSLRPAFYYWQGAATFPHNMQETFTLPALITSATHASSCYAPPVSAALLVSMITSQLAMRGKVGTEGKQREGTTSGWICRAKAKAKLIEALFVFAPQAVCCRSSSNSSSSSACIQANRLI